MYFTALVSVLDRLRGRLWITGTKLSRDNKGTAFVNKYCLERIMSIRKCRSAEGASVEILLIGDRRNTGGTWNASILHSLSFSQLPWNAVYYYL